MRSLLLACFVNVSLSLNAQKWSEVYSDTNSYFVNTTTIAGKKYIGYLNRETCFLLNERSDTLVKRKSSSFYSDASFKDINGDGYQDFILTRSSNTPMVLELFIYVPGIRRFKEIKDFEHFPDPIKIPGSRYYYSYHKSGCADLNWDSDLFYIKDYKAVRVGNILGQGCSTEKSDEKKGIYIYKIQKGKKKFFKRLSYSILSNYKDFKWGFIKEYWTKNHRLFSR